MKILVEGHQIWCQYWMKQPSPNIQLGSWTSCCHTMFKLREKRSLESGTKILRHYLLLSFVSLEQLLCLWFLPKQGRWPSSSLQLDICQHRLSWGASINCTFPSTGKYQHYLSKGALLIALYSNLGIPSAGDILGAAGLALLVELRTDLNRERFFVFKSYSSSLRVYLHPLPLVKCNVQL